MGQPPDLGARVTALEAQVRELGDSVGSTSVASAMGNEATEGTGPKISSRAQLEPHAGFGGYRQSCIGREGGRPAIESYTELKTVLLPFTDEMM